MRKNDAILGLESVSRHSSSRSRRRKLGLATAVAFAPLSSLCVRPARGAAQTWSGSTSTDWAALNGFTVIPATGDSLTFGADGTAGTAAGDALTNTLTSSSFSIAGITFGSAAPAYTMTGNTFLLTSGITNNSTNLETFSNTAGLTSNGGFTYALSGGITITNGLTNTSGGGVTTTVNGAGQTLTIGGYNINTAGNRVGGIFNGSGNVNITGSLTGGDIIDNFTYSGSGVLTLSGGVALNGNAAATLNVSSGEMILSSANAGAVVNTSGTGEFDETAGGSIGTTGGDAALNQASSVTSYLAGANTYTLGTSVTAGTLNLTGTLTASNVTTSSTGVFTEGAAGVLGSGAQTFTQGSSGTSILSGSNAYTGATAVNAGTLLLDFSGSTTPASEINIIKTSSALTLGGGTLSIKGGGTGDTNSQTFNGTTLTANTASEFSSTQNGDTTLNATLGAITRNSGSVVDFTLPSAGSISTSSTTFLSNSVLVSAASNGVAFATVNGGAAWATLNTGTIGVLVPTPSTYGATANASVGASDSVASGAAIANTLTFNGASDTLTQTGSGTGSITTGGILVTPSSSGADSINGGTLTSGTGKELVIIDDGTGSLSISSIIADSASGSSTLTITGSGITSLGASNLFTNQTNLLGGTLLLKNALALQNSTLQINTGSTLAFDQSVTANSNGFTLGGLTGSGNIALTNNAGTPAAIALTVGGNNANTTYSGTISGLGSITKIGTGTLTLSAAGVAQPYSGGLTVQSGTVLGSGSTSDIGGTGNITLGLAGSNISATVGLATCPGTQTIIVEPGLVATPGSATRSLVTITGTPITIASPISLVQGASFTLVPSGNSIPFTGGVTGTGNIIDLGVAGTGTLAFSGATVNMTGFLENNTTANTGTFTVSAVVGPNVLGIVQNSTTSSLVLSAANTFVGDTTLTKGTLNLQSSLALQNSVLNTNNTAGAVTFGTSAAVGLTAVTLGGLAGNGNVNLNNFLTTPTAVALTIGNSNSTLSGTNSITGLTVTNTLNPTYSGNLSNTNGAASVTKVGSNTQTFSGSNTYTGATAVSAGNLTLSGTLNGTSGTSTSGTGTFNETSTGVISTGTFSQGSSGLSTLAGANTYGGTTTVSGTGTLALASTGSLGNTAVSVGSAATAGALQINGNYTIGSTAASVAVGGTTGAGTISFPNSESSTSTLTVNNTSANTGLTLGGATSGQAVLNFNTGNTSTDQITTGGLLKVNSGGAVINLAALPTTTLAIGSYNLLSYATSTVPSGVVLGTYTAPAGNIFYLTSTATAVTLNDAAGASANAYWTGSQSSVWNTNPSGPTNFVNAPTGGTSTGLPDSTTNVFITANSAMNLSMTLGQGFDINSLNFTGTNTADTAGSTIAGALTPLTIEATNANGNTVRSGITVAGGSGANTISAPIILDGTQSWTNSSTSLLTVSGAVTNSGFTLTTAGTGPMTISGAIGGAGGLTDTSTGVVTLNAANGYTGPTLVNGGILYLGNAAAIKTSSSVTANGSGLIGLQQAATESSQLASGVVIQGTGGITNEINNGNTAVTLDRANTYTGPTTWAIRGVTRAGIASAYDVNGNQTSGAFGVNSAVVFTNNQCSLELQGFNNQVGSLAGTGGGGSGVQLLGATLTIGGDNTSTTYTGPISNNYILGGDTNTTGTNPLVQGGNLVKIGSGTQTFNANGTSVAASSYEGTTTIEGGVLSVNLLGTSGYVSTGITTTTTTAATVTSNTGLAVGQYLYDVPAVKVGTTITAISGTSITLSAAPAAAKTIADASFGYLNSLGISSSAASNLVLDGGTLQYTGAATSTDRLFTVGSTEAGGATGTLDASGTGSVNFTNTGPLAYGSGTGTRTLNLTGTNTGANTLSAAIGDNSNGPSAVSVTKTGTGSWTLAGANSYSGGTTVTQGTLTSTVTGGFGTGNVTVNPTGTAGDSTDTATLNTTGSIASTAAVTVNTNSATALGNIYFNGANPTIGSLAGTGNVVLNNQSGNTALTTGDSTNTVFSGAIRDFSSGQASSLIKQGSGVFTLSGGGNSYHGGTTVTAGTLYVNNTGGDGTGNGAVAVNAGTLGGIGTLGGNLTVAASATATLSPGSPDSMANQLGTLVDQGNASLGDGSNFVATLNSDTSTGGTAGGGQASLLNVTGTIALGSTTGMTTSGATLVVNDLGTGQSFTPGTLYTIVASTGLTDTFAGLAEGATVTATNGSTYTISYADGDDAVLDSVSAPTPEPGSLGLLGVAGVMMMRRRRRSATKA
jgi:fibronectin-binding autotransporter adhesin